MSVQHVCLFLRPYPLKAEVSDLSVAGSESNFLKHLQSLFGGLLISIVPTFLYFFECLFGLQALHYLRQVPVYLFCEVQYATIQAPKFRLKKTPRQKS